MALTGLEIFKLLPNKNCGECGVPTCLAFAMKLAAKSAEPTLCPYISEKSLEVLGASQSPPIKKLTFNIDKAKYEIGAETVLYRHDKTFLNKTLIACEISDNLSDSDFSKKLEQIKSYTFDRVGEKLFPECISLVYDSNKIESYISKFKSIISTDKIIIMSKINPDLLAQLLDIEKNHSRLILDAINKENLESFKNVIANKELKVVIESVDLASLFDLVQEAEKNNIKNIMLKVKTNSIAKLLEVNTALRRLSIKKSFKPAGYPVITECDDNINTAITAICKYSSMIILKKYDGASLFTLLSLRQNIYTDPQKPLQIQPGVYNIGEPTKDSPLIVTTNFSLTYFIVSGEVENSPHAARLLITDSEGMSVLTAWSANKFSASLIAKSVANAKVEEQISHRKLIIPGYVAVLKGDLEDQLKGWDIMVGPQEASDLPQYLNEMWK